MLKTFFQTLTDHIIGSSPTAKTADRTATEESGIDVWRYAEPAGEEPDPLQRNVLQWRRLISSVRDPLAVFPGQPVDIIGFVHRPPNTGAEQFILARHIIRCCLADTVPLGLVIHSPHAADFASDTWLHIQGQFAAVPVHPRPLLMVEPTAIQTIPEPQRPYINGVF